MPATTQGGHAVREIEDPAGKRQKVTVNLGESPLLWLRARGLIADRLYHAGEQLHSDWERAGMEPRITMRWDGMPPSGRRGGSPDGFAGRSAAAKQRLDGALAAAGPGLSDILWRVVCAGEGLNAAEKALGWPLRAGKLVLTLALERVADYYRIN